MHDWTWAWKQMQAGNYVRCENWHAGLYWSFDIEREEVSQHRKGAVLSTHITDMEISDANSDKWELWEPEPESEFAQNYETILKNCPIECLLKELVTRPGWAISAVASP